MFLAAIGILVYSMSDADGFARIWRYFAWSNQTLAVFTLWAVTVWLFREGKCYWITLIPALFMTAVCTTYLFIAPEGFSWAADTSYTLGGLEAAQERSVIPLGGLAPLGQPGVSRQEGGRGCGSAPSNGKISFSPTAVALAFHYI